MLERYGAAPADGGRVGGLTASPPASRSPSRRLQFLQAHAARRRVRRAAAGRADAALTSWAVLGLRAAGGRRAGLAGVPAGPGGDARSRRPTSRSLRSPRRRSARSRRRCSTGSGRAAVRAARSARPSTRRAGPCWRSAVRRAATTRFVLAHQARSGGFAWAIGGQPDSNDTAAALEALRVAGVHGAPVDRAVRSCSAFQNRDGGFELTQGRGSDAQSTAWAIQGLVAAGRKPPRTAFAYLRELRQRRRQLPLLGEVRSDARLGHLAGARSAGEEAVSALLTKPRV